MARRWAAWALPIGVLAAATPARSQIEEGLIVQPAIPQDFSRGRNLSVLQQPRPDYAPVGLPVGGLQFYPSAQVGVGVTSNTFLSSTNAVASPYASFEGDGRLISTWLRHSLEITGSTVQRAYIGHSRRNEDLWSVGADGRLDVLHSIALSGVVNASQNFENLFSGEVTPTVAALSRFRRVFESGKATYTQGRVRTFLLLDHSSFSFSSVPLTSGGSLDQRYRDRQVTRLTGQFEYARTPSLSLFAQLGGERTSYDRLLPGGIPALDSRAVRALGGVNIDVAGRIRGTIGLGYSIRNYDSGLYRTVRGLSVETRVEVFPTQRLTVDVDGQRTIEDATVGTFNPYWNTRVGLSADYELLRNLILSAAAAYARQNYLNSAQRNNVYQASAGGRYLVSRRVTLRANVNYSRRQTLDSVGAIGPVSEVRAEATVGYQL